MEKSHVHIYEGNICRIPICIYAHTYIVMQHHILEIQENLETKVFKCSKKDIHCFLSLVHLFIFPQTTKIIHKYLVMSAP